MTSAVSFTVTGLHGTLVLLAVLLFLAAAMVNAFAPGHRLVLTLIAAGLCLWSLAALVSG